MKKTHSLAFPVRFRAARNRLGLSRAKLAPLLQVNHETISRWESGEREPTVTKLKRVYDIMGAEALPHTEEGLRGRMKFFRMKNGFSRFLAAKKIGECEDWWSKLEGGNASIKYAEIGHLIELLNEEIDLRRTTELAPQ